MVSSLARVLLLASCATFLFVSAQDDAAAQEAAAQQAAQEQQMPQPLPGIDTVVVFPDVSDNRFALGGIGKLLIGVKNNAQATINITAVTGSLQSPFDLAYYVQNFTASEIGLVLSPGESASILYPFMPYHSLDPMMFHFSSMMLYHDSEEYHISTVFNQTIELFEPASDLDAKEVFTFSAGVAITAVVAFALFKFTHVSAQEKSKAKKSKSASVSQSDNEWVVQRNSRSSGRRVKK